MEIKKVLEYKNGSKVVIVPRKSDIVAGDFVLIQKVQVQQMQEAPVSD